LKEATMGLLDENVKNELKEVFKNLKDSVKLIVFTQESSLTLPESDCPTCKDNRLLMEEVASLSDKIALEVYDFLKDKDKIKQYNVDKVPIIIVEGQKDIGIRIYGVPAGYEFPTLLNAIKIVSQANSELSDQSKKKLKELSKPVHIQVFVTLTCPYCASAATMSHKMALESDSIKADVINAQEFPQLAQKYNVFAVPKIVINETTQFEGSLPEDAFVQKVIESVGAPVEKITRR
jgi:glutaredoxin-like protein